MENNNSRRKQGKGCAVMMCQKCNKRPATVYYKETVNSITTKAALCEECAKAAGIGFNKILGNNIFDFGIKSLFANASEDKKLEGEKVCPVCSSTFSQIASSGKPGCSKCYSVFEKELAPTVFKIHGKARHIGKSPLRNGAVKPTTKEDILASKKKELNEAIELQEFERAAQLRDEIKETEKEKDKE